MNWGEKRAALFWGCQNEEVCQTSKRRYQQASSNKGLDVNENLRKYTFQSRSPQSRKPAHQTLATSDICRSLRSGNAKTKLKNSHPALASTALEKWDCTVEGKWPVLGLSASLSSAQALRLGGRPVLSPSLNYSEAQAAGTAKISSKQVLNVHINRLSP